MEIRLSPHDGDTVSIAVHDQGSETAKLLTLTSYEACRLLLRDYEFDEILDIGSGSYQHSVLFKAFGKKVTTIDAIADADFVGDYVATKLPRQYPAIWCSHVLEHQRNVGAFLDKIFDDLKEGGVLAITVPPTTNHWISSEHCNWFNGGMLLYHLVMAGFDCRCARVLTYRYNVSILLTKVPTGRPRFAYAPDLKDIEEFLPPHMIRDGGMNGAIHSYRAEHELPANPHPAAAIEYAPGEVRYLIDQGQITKAKHVLDESLQFNSLNQRLLDLQAELINLITALEPGPAARHKHDHQALRLQPFVATSEPSLPF